LTSPEDVLGSGGCRIDGRNRFEQASLLEVAATEEERWVPGDGQRQTGEGIRIGRLIDVHGGSDSLPPEIHRHD